MSKFALNREQFLASSPDLSVWVSASAGTGKTKVLTSRVLRLLLSGVQLEKILCLTFTKAAAREMDARINDSLEKWANLSKKELDIELTSHLMRSPTKEELETAQNLFRLKINSFYPLKIQTIHSFCQYILKNFPLEAGIAPGFKVIDEFKSYEIITAINKNLVSNMLYHEKSLFSAVNFFTSVLHEITVEDLINKIIFTRDKFDYLFSLFADENIYSEYLKKKFQISSFNCIKDIENDFIEKIKKFHQIDKGLFASFLDISASDQNNVEIYNNFLINCARDLIDDFCNIFLTAKGQPRKNIFSAKFYKNYDFNLDFLDEIQNLCVNFKDRLASFNLVSFSKNLFILANYIISSYNQYKNTYGYLDYDDLISKVKNLLLDSQTREWVLYKLDSGVDHILIDEAQDTSKSQWQIIEALMQEFYSGDSEKVRTLFVVGDEKQSIYSFQGADYNSFKFMNNYLSTKLISAKKNYQNINLTTSYRSNQLILDFVDSLFRNFNFSAKLQASRERAVGRIDLWDLVCDDEFEQEPWPLPKMQSDSLFANEKLAKKIAFYISELVHKEIFLPSLNRAALPGDFLILVRRRNDFTGYLLKYLKFYEVAVAGVDRMLLIDSIAVKDILSLAKFILLPCDDLNLACLLKSSFFELTDQDLYDLAANRGDSSLYGFIKIHNQDLANKLLLFEKIYLKNSLYQFFFSIINNYFRANLISHHGLESGDAIDEFINIVKSFEREEGNNLQHFIVWFEKSEIEIKRNLDSEQAVRIMTVHGAKGLQAKIVILADTTSVPRMQEDFLWTEEGVCLWPGNARNYNNEYLRLINDRKAEDYSEYLRLLYVALTRAEDELIICGYKSKITASSSDSGDKESRSWYQLIKDNFTKLVQENIFDEILGEQILRYSSVKYEFKKLEAKYSSVDNSLTLGPGCDFFEKNEHLIKEENLVNLGYGDSFFSLKAVDFGKIIHKIFEDFIKSGRMLVINQHKLLDKLSNKDQIIKNFYKIINSNEFIRLEDFELKAEVEIGYKKSNNELAIIRIDLLAVNSHEVIIIDYKTDRLHAEYNIPSEYIMQVKNYKKIMREIYPKHKIKGYILWFYNQVFTEV